MKLKTKLLLGSGVVFFFAFALCAGLLLSGSVESVRETLMRNTESQQQMLQRHFSAELESAAAATELAWRSRVIYVFRNLSQDLGDDTWYVLLQGEEVLQNNSDVVLLPSTEPVDRTAKVESRLQRQNGRWYCVAQCYCRIGAAEYTIGVVRDVTQDMERLYTRVAWGVSVCVLLLIAALAAVSFLVQKALGPVKQLQQAANAIAGGDYGKRLDVKSHDEIGALAGNFNHMAQVIETHIEEVEATAQERQYLLRALAHEMRTPVTAISGYAHALRYAAMEDSDKLEAVEFLEEESLRLERLSTKLTELITLENYEIHRENIDGAAFAGALEKVLRPLASTAGIELAITAEGSFSGDRDLLMSVLTNLFDNARKAGAAKVKISIRPQGFRVSDNGKGIPASEISRVTQAFYQVDSSRHEGFGFGLALCRRIAELHGGTLDIQSVEGKGTEITFLLQIHDDMQTGRKVE